MKNALLRVWRGEESLFVTFWLWLVLGGLIVSLPQTMLMLAGYSFPADAFVQAYAFCLYRLCVLAFQFVVSVGLWRAAGLDGIDWPDKFWRLGARVVALATIGGVIGVGFVETAVRIYMVSMSLL
ncbi:hypothetical protein [Oleidesulfovibrio sp.]|uniref:hypothetical protein n=1 Tax=Oleidesulfovibrio sp. TaxID=2909707 RepID=UPI003A87116E